MLFFAFGSGQVRSPGQVKWPHLRKTFKLRHGHSSGDKDLKLSGFGILPSTYNLYISEFLYRWPKVRSFLESHHYKSMGELSTSSECHLIHSICSGSWYYRSLVVIIPKNITGDLWKVSLGHPRSPEITSGFSAITFYWIEIETPFDVYRVFLVNAHQMICNMTYFGQVMTLTWGQIFNLTFRGHVIYHSMRLDELRTMAFKSIRYLVWRKSYLRKTIRRKNEHFFFGDLWWPSFWPDRKNDRSSFVIIFDELSNAFFLFSLRPIPAEIEGGFQTPPPPQ